MHGLPVLDIGGVSSGDGLVQGRVASNRNFHRNLLGMKSPLFAIGGVPVRAAF